MDKYNCRINVVRGFYFILLRIDLDAIFSSFHSNPVITTNSFIRCIMECFVALSIISSSESQTIELNKAVLILNCLLSECNKLRYLK